MGAISTSIGLERRASVSGYTIKKGFFNDETDNLPQRILILGEANTANQTGLNTDAKEIVSASQAADLYGDGSPIHQVMRILRPKNSVGVGGIPTIVIPQVSAGGATATTVVWTLTGAATKNKTHYVVINGRKSLDQNKYAVNIVKGDSVTVVATKIKNAVTAVTGCPVTVTNVAGVLTFVTKWKGLTSAEINISFDVEGDNVGIAYALTTTTAGAGAVDLDDAFEQFEDTWYTIVINTYGSTAFDDLEVFNGFPDDENPTGRYAGEIFKPFIAFFGSTLSDVTALSDITDADERKNQCTNALSPAPNSEGFTWEAAANMAYIFAVIAQNDPQLDVDGIAYPDMPVPANKLIGDMSVYNNRDFLVKKGCSTVILKSGVYVAKDLVTTYHGEDSLYSYPRNLNIDFNFKNGYSILEDIRVKGHVIVSDKQVTDARKVIKPKEWKSVLFSYVDELAEAALIEDPDFSKSTILVQKSTDNPDRFETSLSYKRTGFSRIQSTTVTAGF